MYILYMIFICIYHPSLWLWTFTCFGGAPCLIVYAPESHTLSNYRVRLVSGKKKNCPSAEMSSIPVPRCPGQYRNVQYWVPRCPSQYRNVQVPRCLGFIMIKDVDKSRDTTVRGYFLVNYLWYFMQYHSWKWIVHSVHKTIFLEKMCLFVFTWNNIIRIYLLVLVFNPSYFHFCTYYVERLVLIGRWFLQ